MNAGPNDSARRRPRCNTVTGAAADELTPRQMQRRLRILDETLTLAGGGYEAVSMRAVAARSNVAMGTLYRYFPSKGHLLVSAFSLWLTRFERGLRAHLTGTVDPFARLRTTMTRLTGLVDTQPQMSSTMVRAYLFADASVAVEVENVRAQLVGIFAAVMSCGAVIESDMYVGELLSDVLASNLLAVARGRRDVAEVRRELAAVLTVLARQPWSRNSTAPTPMN